MRDTRMYAHGITFGGHPVASAVALKNIEIMKRDQIVEHVAATQDVFKAKLEPAARTADRRRCPRNRLLLAVELVKDRDTKATFDDEECETLLRQFLSPRLFERGLICRRTTAVTRSFRSPHRWSPGEEEFDQIVSILGDVLAEAWARVRR
jgi:adenosylmethionine-8-amino-7-oxononanoate aminotransferase